MNGKIKPQKQNKNKGIIRYLFYLLKSKKLFTWNIKPLLRKHKNLLYDKISVLAELGKGEKED